MDKLIRKYVSAETSEKNNFIWNMIGSLIFSAASMLLSLIVIRIVGADDGGVFAIAITVAQMLAFIEYYEIRTYQVTDVKNEFSLGEYKAVKIVLLWVSVIVGLVYSIIKGQAILYKFAVIFLMCIYRYIDAYADLYEGTFQKDGRLDLTGKSQAFRTILSVVAMFVTVIFTGNLVVSIVIAIIFAVIGLIIFDVLPMKCFVSIKVNWKRNSVFKILKQCFPLFVGSFLWSYLLSASRIAVDANMTSNFSAYFQTLFMPVSIINLCATFVLKPALTELSEKYAMINRKPFIQSVLKIVILILCFTFICVLGAYVLGIPILQILTGTDLLKYKNTLVVLMVAGGINSLAYFGYYILTIMRKNRWIFGGYIVASIVAKFVNDYMVKRDALMGAAIGFLISVVVLLIIFFIGISCTLYSKTNKN